MFVASNKTTHFGSVSYIIGQGLLAFRRKRLFSLLTLLIVILGGLLPVTSLRAQIYVANFGSSTIGEYTLTGGTVNASLISTGLNLPHGIVVSGSNIFVTNQGGSTIGEYTTSGGTVNTSLLSGSTINGQCFAVLGTDIFVTSNFLHNIAEYTTSGTLVNFSLVSGLASVDVIAVSETNIFVTNHASGSGTIGEYTLLAGRWRLRW